MSTDHISKTCWDRPACPISCIVGVAIAASLCTWIAAKMWRLPADVPLGADLLLVCATGFSALAVLRRHARLGETLRTTEQQFRGVMVTAVDGVLALRAVRGALGTITDYRVLIANPAAERLLGVAWDRNPNQSFRAALPADFVDPLLIAFETVVKSGEPIEFVHEHGTGTSARYLRTVVVPLGDGVAVTFDDVTQRCNADKELAKTSAHLAQLMRSVPLPMLGFDIEGRLTHWNAAAERVFGWTAEETLGQLAKFVMPADQGNFSRRQAFIASGGVITGDLVQRQCKDGRIIDLSVSVAPLRDESGRIYGSLAVYDDITARRHLEHAIGVSESRLKLALDVSNVGLWDWNLETGYTYFSETWCRMLGYASGELPGAQSSFAALSHPEDIQGVMAQWTDHVEGRTAGFQCELRMRHKEGYWIWVRTSGRVIDRDSAGKPLRALGTHTDVTAYRRSEAELGASTVRLRAVLDASPLPALIHTLDGIVLQWSPAAERLFGWTAEQVIGHPVPFIPNELLEDYRLNIRKPVAAGERVTSHQTRRRRRDGTLIDTMVSAGPLRGIDGSIDSILVIISDETERLAAEETIRSQREFLRNVLDVNPNLIFVKDEQGRFTLVNKAFADACGATVDSLIGKSVADIVPYSEEVDRLRQDDLHVMSTHTDHTRDNVEVISPNGISRMWKTLKRPLIDSDGVCRQLIGVSFDITEQDRAQRDLAAAKEAAERARQLAEESREVADSANRAKSRFLANMSHEIRTPMTAILGFADRLGDPRVGVTERADCVQTIRRNGNHLLEIINDILDFSKIEAGRMTVEQIEFRPCVVVGDVVSLMRLRAAELGLALDVTYHGAIPQTIKSDPTRLRQGLMNLLSNAIKFTNTGCVKVDVELRDEGGKRRLAFAVSDSGVGMTRDEQTRLFQPFIQADASTTRQYGGTGLGLVIIKRLALMMGGDVTARSEVGVGSTFTLTIDPGDLTGIPMVADPLVETFAPVPTPPTVKEPFLTGRVLFAEDGVDNQRLISRLLRYRGLTVEVVDNGRRVLDCVAAAVEPFDLILMDMQMPEMDGYAATAALRAGGYTGPIVAVTAHVTDDDRRTCLGAGCNDYLAKPLNAQAFSATLGRYLRVAGPKVEPLVSRYKQDSTMRDLVELYVAGLPSLVHELERQVQTVDLVNLRQSAHRLKGSGGGYGFDTISEKAAMAEHCVRAEKPFNEIRAAVDELIHVLRHVEGYRRDSEKVAREAA